MTKRNYSDPLMDIQRNVVSYAILAVLAILTKEKHKKGGSLSVIISHPKFLFLIEKWFGIKVTPRNFRYHLKKLADKKYIVKQRRYRICPKPNRNRVGLIKLGAPSSFYITNAGWELLMRKLGEFSYFLKMNYLYDKTSNTTKAPNKEFFVMLKENNLHKVYCVMWSVWNILFGESSSSFKEYIRARIGRAFKNYKLLYEKGQVSGHKRWNLVYFGKTRITLRSFLKALTPRERICLRKMLDCRRFKNKKNEMRYFYVLKTSLRRRLYWRFFKSLWGWFIAHFTELRINSKRLIVVSDRWKIFSVVKRKDLGELFKPPKIVVSESLSSTSSSSAIASSLDSSLGSSKHGSVSMDREIKIAPKDKESLNQKFEIELILNSVYNLAKPVFRFKKVINLSKEEFKLGTKGIRAILKSLKLDPKTICYRLLISRRVSRKSYPELIYPAVYAWGVLEP